MDILGIGPLELIFILIIALIIFGPNDLVKAGKTAGNFMRKIVQSPEWRTVQKASKDLRTLPNRLMREAGVDEFKQEIGDLKPPSINRPNLSTWTTPPDPEVLTTKDDPVPSTPPSEESVD